MRRNLPRGCRALPGSTPGESGVVESVNSLEEPQSRSSSSSSLCNIQNIRISRNFQHNISIFMVNIQSLRGHQAELVYHLEKEEPHIVLLQET